MSLIFKQKSSWIVFAVDYGVEYFNGKTVDNTDIAKLAIDAVKN